MKPKKILCPVDFSPCSDVALQHAVELAGVSGAKLVVMHIVAPPPTYVSGFAGYGELPPYSPEPDPRLDQLEIPDGVDVERVHIMGLEGATVVEFAEQKECDLIVMGTHGYGGITKMLLGSVADYVLRHAKGAVIIVKDRHRETAEKASAAATA